MKNKQLGEIFKEIRQIKGISQSAIINQKLSQSALSRFETGESSLSADKFILALENAGIEFDEFYRYLQTKNRTEHPLFTTEAVLAHINSDSKELENLIHQQEVYFEENKNPLYRLAIIYTRCLEGLLTQKAEVDSADVNYAFDYLLTLKNWGRFEIRLSSAFVNIFNKKQLYQLSENLFERCSYFTKDPKTMGYFYELLFNLADVLVAMKSYALAKELLSKVKIEAIPDHLTREKIYFNFNINLVDFYLGETKALEKMKEIQQACKSLDLKQFLNGLTADIETCEKSLLSTN